MKRHVLTPNKLCLQTKMSNATPNSWMEKPSTKPEHFHFEITRVWWLGCHSRIALISSLCMTLFMAWETRTANTRREKILKNSFPDSKRNMERYLEQSKQTEPPKINFFSLLKKLMETRQTFARNTSRKHHLSFPKKCISKYKQRTWQTRKQAVQVSTKGHKTELEIAKMRTLRGYRSVWLIVKQLTFRFWPDSSLFTGILEYILDMQFGKDRRTHASKEYWWWMLFQTLTFCHEPLVTKL